MYPGGKNKLYQKIINQIPPHRVYIEPFVGSGAVLRHKKPASGNIAIDADTSAINKLRCSLVNTNDVTRYQLINTNAIDWLKTYQFRGDEFVYADPPYVLSTRRQRRHIYRYELTDRQHAELLAVLTAINCQVMISGYWSDLYADRLSEWSTVSFETTTRGGSWATEYLWMNYPPPLKLHDYQYLGDDFRERERIKRKANRWAKRFGMLPRLEQQAILAALNDRVN